MKTQLTSNYISSNILTRFNDTEFLELLPTAVGIEVPELFILYNELLDKMISAGTAKFVVDFNIPQEYHLVAFEGKFKNVLTYSVNSPNFSLSPQSVMLGEGERDTVSYLFQSSLKYVPVVNDSVEYLFTNVVDQFSISESINLALISLNEERSALEYHYVVIVETLKSLTAPNSSTGFQVVPDILGVVRGQSVMTAVTGGYQPFSPPIFDNPASAAALTVTYGVDELVREVTITPTNTAPAGHYYFRLEDAQGVSDLVAVNVEIPEGDIPPKTGPLAITGMVTLTLNVDQILDITDGIPPFTIINPANPDIVHVSLIKSKDGVGQPWQLQLVPRRLGITQFTIEDSSPNGNKRTGSVLIKVLAAPRDRI